MELLAKLLQKVKKGSYKTIFLALFCYLLYHLIKVRFHQLTDSFALFSALEAVEVHFNCLDSS